MSDSGLWCRGEALVGVRGWGPLVALRRLGGLAPGMALGVEAGSVDRAGEPRCSAASAEAGFRDRLWSVWDELPEPVGLSIGAERAGRVVLDKGHVYAGCCLDELRRELVVCRQVAKADVLAFITQYGESEE